MIEHGSIMFDKYSTTSTWVGLMFRLDTSRTCQVHQNVLREVSSMQACVSPPLLRTVEWRHPGFDMFWLFLNWVCHRNWSIILQPTSCWFIWSSELASTSRLTDSNSTSHDRNMCQLKHTTRLMFKQVGAPFWLGFLLLAPYKWSLVTSCYMQSLCLV